MLAVNPGRKQSSSEDVRATGRQLKGVNPRHGLVGLSHRNPILCSEIALSRCSPKAPGFFNRSMSSFPNAVLLSMIAMICLQLSQDVFLAQSSPRDTRAGSGGSPLLAPPFPFPGWCTGCWHVLQGGVGCVPALSPARQSWAANVEGFRRRSLAGKMDWEMRRD